VAEANVTVVRRLFDAAERRDNELVLSLYDEAVVWDASRTTRGEMAGRVARGRDDLVSWFRRWYDAWEGVEDRLDELVELADGRVLSVIAQRARGRASGLELENSLAALWTVEAGKVVQVAWFPTREEALAEAGVEP
jgi:ketosteroid isomerase-like protein